MNHILIHHHHLYFHKSSTVQDVEYIDIVLCTAYFVFVFVLTFPHPGLYWTYGNKDDDDDLLQSSPTLCTLSHFQSIQYSRVNTFA
jgi:hypothetical protein